LKQSQNTFVKNLPRISLCLLTLFLQTLRAETQSASAPGALLFRDDFDSDLSQWVVEQVAPGTTQIQQGALDIHDVGGCTVWFKEKLSSPVLIECEVTMIQAGGANDRVSDLNVFWMATDPANPEKFFANSAKRAGLFKNYHPLRLYYVGYGANDNTSTRFRRYPGDGSRPLLPEHDLSDASLMNVPNKTIKIQLLADGGKIQFLRDGEVVFDFPDREPFREGWFGIRTLHNHMRVDAFRVYKPQPAP